MRWIGPVRFGVTPRIPYPLLQRGDGPSPGSVQPVDPRHPDAGVLRGQRFELRMQPRQRLRRQDARQCQVTPVVMFGGLHIR